MSADPRNPKVGDVFVRVDEEITSEVLTVTAVGQEQLLYVGVNGTEWPTRLATVAAYWQPAPEPLITKPVTLGLATDGCWYSNFAPADRHITILPDHTWREGP